VVGVGGGVGGERAAFFRAVQADGADEAVPLLSTNGQSYVDPTDRQPAQGPRHHPQRRRPPELHQVTAVVLLFVCLAAAVERNTEGKRERKESPSPAANPPLMSRSSGGAALFLSRDGSVFARGARRLERIIDIPRGAFLHCLLMMISHLVARRRPPPPPQRGGRWGSRGHRCGVGCCAGLKTSHRRKCGSYATHQYRDALGARLDR